MIASLGFLLSFFKLDGFGRTLDRNYSSYVLVACRLLEWGIVPAFRLSIFLEPIMLSPGIVPSNLIASCQSNFHHRPIFLQDLVTRCFIPPISFRVSLSSSASDWATTNGLQPNSSHITPRTNHVAGILLSRRTSPSSRNFPILFFWLLFLEVVWLYLG